MTHRAKKNVSSDDLKIKLCVYAFDLLFFNGEAIINKDFIFRRKMLHDNFPLVKSRFHFAEHKDAE